MEFNHLSDNIQMKRNNPKKLSVLSRKLHKNRMFVISHDTGRHLRMLLKDTLHRRPVINNQSDLEGEILICH
mgnify:CR=1 FL=1